jgi:hypothetical protein
MSIMVSFAEPLFNNRFVQRSFVAKIRRPCTGLNVIGARPL